MPDFDLRDIVKLLETAGFAVRIEGDTSDPCHAILRAQNKDGHWLVLEEGVEGSRKICPI